MGRGLSPLRRRILLLARDDREAGRSGKRGPDVCTAEVPATVYGFPVPSDRDPRDPHRRTFSREEIGARTCDRAAAAVSRALRRPEERGLLRPVHPYRRTAHRGRPPDR